MDLDTAYLPGLSPVAGKKVQASFDGGLLSSDGGLLLLREVERKLGIAERLAACLHDRRTAEKVRNTVAEMIRFRMFAITAGYEDANDCDFGAQECKFRKVDAKTHGFKQNVWVSASGYERS